MRYAALTDLGKKRNLNEDGYIANGQIFAVADGMGGHRAGEIASALALDALRFGLAKRSKTTIENRLRDAIKRANKQVHDTAVREAARRGMGTTLTAVLPVEDKLYIGHVGDSRLYRLRDGILKQITNDHSLVAQLVKSGRLKVEEAEMHPQRNIITRAIGSDRDVEIDVFIEDILPTDRYLLCSDGLTSMLNDNEIAEVLRDKEDLEEACRELVEWANDRGGNDNITVVLFEPQEKSAGLFNLQWLQRK
jgi:serine/threonine protein phosphatase PrpC